jgi:NADH-quinone oxidoreductase subunit J
MIINSGFYLLLGAEFLAVVQMLIYVSGIVVLLIFVIMLTDTLQNEDVDVNMSRKLISIIISSVFFLINVFAIIFIFPESNDYVINLTVYEESNLANIGFKLLDIGYSGYVIPFEIISLLLLTSLVGCLKISRK